MADFTDGTLWKDVTHKVQLAYRGTKVDAEKELAGPLTICLYEMLQEDDLTVEPGDNAGIRFETKWSAILLDPTDGLYCEHKSAHADSYDTPGPTPDHPDHTTYGTYCDDCREWLEPEEPDYDD